MSHNSRFPLGKILSITKVVILLLATTRLSSSSKSGSIGQILDPGLGSDGSIYDRLRHKAKFPPLVDGRPLTVLAGMYLESIGKFQASEMSFDVDMYLYLSWKDSSLSHSNPEYVLVNNPEERKFIWLPDLYFANARISKFHDVTVPNFSLFIAQDGTIAYSIRITLNVACNLNLKNYPMDKQVCGIRLVSYAHIEKQMNITWFENAPIRYNQEIALPELNIGRMDPTLCNGSYRYAIMVDGRYNYEKFSCLEANIYLNRQIGYHLLQSFAPTGLIVMISWVSFWIDRRAVPGRVTLSFTTLLSLSTLGNGMRIGLPQVTYAKAIDIWFGACMLFVFMSLLEFAVVNSYMRAAEKLEKLASVAANEMVVLVDADDLPSQSGEKPTATKSDDDNEPFSAKKKSVMCFRSPNPSPNMQQRQPNNVNDYDRREEYNRILNFSKSPSTSTKFYQSIREFSESRAKSPTISTQTFHSIDENNRERSQVVDRANRNGKDPAEPAENTINSGINDERTSDNWDNNIPPKLESVPKQNDHPNSARRLRKFHTKRGNMNASDGFILRGLKLSERAQTIDKWSRFIFPICFLLFNIYYWISYGIIGLS